MLWDEAGIPLWSYLDVTLFSQFAAIRRFGHQSLLMCKRRSLDAVFKVEFVKNIFQVGFDGVLGHAELSSDLFIGQALCHKLEHIPFPRAQLVLETLL